MKPKNQTIHAINNHLATIMLTVELVANGTTGPVTAQQKKHLDAVLSECKKLQKLVKDLQD